MFPLPEYKDLWKDGFLQIVGLLFPVELPNWRKNQRKWNSNGISGEVRRRPWWTCNCCHHREGFRYLLKSLGLSNLCRLFKQTNVCSVPEKWKQETESIGSYHLPDPLMVNQPIALDSHHQAFSGKTLWIGAIAMKLSSLFSLTLRRSRKSLSSRCLSKLFAIPTPGSSLTRRGNCLWQRFISQLTAKCTHSDRTVQQGLS